MGEARRRQTPRDRECGDTSLIAELKSISSIIYSRFVFSYTPPYISQKRPAHVVIVPLGIRNLSPKKQLFSFFLRKLCGQGMGLLLRFVIYSFYPAIAIGCFLFAENCIIDVGCILDSHCLRCVLLRIKLRDNLSF